MQKGIKNVYMNFDKRTEWVNGENKQYETEEKKKTQNETKETINNVKLSKTKE